MGTRIVVSRAGLAQIQAAVGRMTERLVDEIAADARNYAPVDTGELVASIEGEARGTSGRVSASADHAAYVELGTENMRAQPYLRPALYKKRAVSS